MGWFSWWYVNAAICINVGVILYLYNKKKLPIESARVVGKLSFWPTVPFTMARLLIGLRRNWWDQVDQGVYLGGVPVVYFDHVGQLHSLGVRAVVNLCDEYEGPVEEYKKRDMQQLHVPTVDHFEPSVDTLKKTVEFINEHRNKGESVYIHCKAGHGRSAAVAFAWLLFKHRLSLGDAQELILSKRTVRKALYKQPNINQFYQSLQ
ncbi:hypothetical protein PROFUN_04664 [Planoprotostelium fungivorum]|uniref:Uncharacterized protein n=1 Tax=Planoprotostelium fungivorum TaxID=1890364 RepID=A0A2P6NUJ3_9EUKA|nr:hypothetical protein PROFUN_04664 [Planoprotostelium fungivorum]